jgi:hypothetical protein
MQFRVPISIWIIITFTFLHVLLTAEDFVTST